MFFWSPNGRSKRDEALFYSSIFHVKFPTVQLHMARLHERRGEAWLPPSRNAETTRTGRRGCARGGKAAPRTSPTRAARVRAACSAPTRASNLRTAPALWGPLAARTFGAAAQARATAMPCSPALCPASGEPALRRQRVAPAATPGIRAAVITVAGAAGSARAEAL